MALLDFPNVVGQNDSNSDSDESHQGCDAQKNDFTMDLLLFQLFPAHVHQDAAGRVIVV